MDNPTFNAALSSVAAHTQVETDYIQTSDIFNAVDSRPAELDDDYEGK